MKHTTEIHKYPDPNKIEINEADFELELRNYRRSLKNKISWSDLLLLIPAWAILFTSNFRDFWIFSGEQIKGAYFILIAIGTLIIGGKVLRSIVKSFMDKSFKDVKGFKESVKVLFRDECSPEEVIKDIKNKCKHSGE